MAQKTTFFSSGQSSWNFEFAQAVSYQKKIIKNIGERILALSIAVFGGFVIENCSFFLYFFVNAITSLAGIKFRNYDNVSWNFMNMYRISKISFIDMSNHFLFSVIRDWANRHSVQIFGIYFIPTFTLCFLLPGRKSIAPPLLSLFWNTKRMQFSEILLVHKKGENIWHSLVQPKEKV